MIYKGNMFHFGKWRIITKRNLERKIDRAYVKGLAAASPPQDNKDTNGEKNA